MKLHSLKSVQCCMPSSEGVLPLAMFGAAKMSLSINSPLNAPSNVCLEKSPVCCVIWSRAENATAKAKRTKS